MAEVAEGVPWAKQGRLRRQKAAIKQATKRFLFCSITCIVPQFIYVNIERKRAKAKGP